MMVDDPSEEAEREEHERQRVIETLTKIYSHLFERSMAYTNVIIVGGYAGAFAIWTYTRDHLPNKVTISVALLLGVSIVAFISFEVFKMIFTTREFLKGRKLILSDFTTRNFFRNVELARRNEERLLLWLMPIWAFTVGIAVIAALLATGILLYYFFSILLS